MREQNKDDKLFFECPAKCGNYLVDVDPTFVLRKEINAHNCSLERAAVKTERCPCGRGVCVQCHQLVPEPEFYKHRCPETKAESKYDEAASLQLMKTLGKPCPNCGMFLIKDEGCDKMLCGDSAHGSLLKAIKSGGCGQHFVWSTMQKTTTIFDVEREFWTEAERRRSRDQSRREECNAPVKYRRKIQELKKKFGTKNAIKTLDNTVVNLEELQVEVVPQEYQQYDTHFNREGNVEPLPDGWEEYYEGNGNKWYCPTDSQLLGVGRSLERNGERYYWQRERPTLPLMLNVQHFPIINPTRNFEIANRINRPLSIGTATFSRLLQGLEQRDAHAFLVEIVTLYNFNHANDHYR